jgi:hypothetical protein
MARPIGGAICRFRAGKITTLLEQEGKAKFALRSMASRVSGTVGT